MRRQPVEALPCGCIPGHVCCAEDTRLWNAVNAAYASGDWQLYQAALLAYRAHRPRPENKA